MALSPGTRIGPHEILAAIGAGGMGDSSTPASMVVVEHWFEELKARVPAK